jgi:hypothetical protein
MKFIYKATALVAIMALFSFGLVPAALAQYQRPYRYSDNYMRQLLTRLVTRTDRFSNLLPNALDQSRVNGSQREDQVNNLVTNLEHATDVLKNRFNNNQSTTMDAQQVLQEGARIDTFMRNHRLANSTEQAWNLVRTELNRLAAAYNVAANWRYMQWPATTNVPTYSGFDSMLTGTFRLNTAMSNNPEVIADNATRNLQFTERQSVHNNIINKLTPPEMIAMERHGNSVTLASSRTPQVTFDVDGRERTETYPNGRVSRVQANFIGGELKVVSNGDRANDFTATFTPVDNGRRLLVTREIYAERLARPVMVQSYYDRTSDIAQWNVYNGVPIYTGTTSLNFIVPDGTQLVAVLNKDLSTKNANNNDSFTMRVVSPDAYRGAILEGYVTGVNPGRRFSGRSEMTFNFDRIRLRNGEVHQFAGVVDAVQTHNGESALVDNEGGVREDESRTNTTLEHAGIGTAIGALIGAIAGGGQGAAIGAAVGAGAGAGSVYVQGRDDLDLLRGTDFTIRASSPLR